MQRLIITLAALFLFACDAPSASQQTGKNYRVKRGENLYSISERVYGNGLDWPRIWEANPWLNPEQLRPGELIYLPAEGNTWGDPPPRKPPSAAVTPARKTPSKAVKKGRRSANPGGRKGKQVKVPGIKVFHNFATQVSSKTLFGFPAEQTVLVLFVFLMCHAVVQSLFLWLAAHLTFVKEASVRKATKAVFQTELLMFCTLVTLGIVSLVLLYLGQPAKGGDTGKALFPALEGYLQTTTGMAAAAGTLFLLYAILSLRFIPAAFDLRRGRAIPLVVLAVLLPHLAAFYLVGQRMGLM